MRQLFETVPQGASRNNEPLIIDSFAGGGGASTGIEMALGRSPDIAINHDADALAMHQVNHPETLHLSKNIWHVDPLEAVGNRRVGLAWFSPDCKHFSKAKGGRPVKRSIRDLAWVVVLWAKRVRPEVIFLENVEEFKDWGPVSEDGKPCAVRKGETFKRWAGDLKRLGYKLEFRELRACDYGAPTIRKRLFMIARRDGSPIVWPKPTHGPPDDPDVIAGRKLPWRTAAEIIDWSIPCPSIFDTSEEIKAKYGIRAIRPLAEATMRRIARGVVRYVLEAKKPFIVNLTHGARVEDADEPLKTVTCANRGEKAVVVPTFVGCGGRAGQSAPRGGDLPLGTQTAKADGCVVAPVLVETAHGEVSPKGVKRWGFGAKPTDEPVGTITAGGAGKAAIVAAFLKSADVSLGAGFPLGKASDKRDELPNGGEADEDIDGPSHDRTLAAEELGDEIDLEKADKTPVQASDNDENERDDVESAHVSVPSHEACQPETFGGPDCSAAFLAQHNTNMVGHDARTPVSTIVQKGCTQGIVAAHLQNMHGSDRRDQPADAPAPTAMAGGTHAALIAAFLTKYYGEGLPNQAADVPLHSLTTLPRHGLVTVEIDGATYAIADIGMRMLTPRERFRAQSFPDSYILVQDTRLLRSFDKSLSGFFRVAIAPQTIEALLLRYVGLCTARGTLRPHPEKDFASLRGIPNSIEHRAMLTGMHVHRLLPSGFHVEQCPGRGVVA